MHKTQRRVMLRFLKQHAGKWVVAMAPRDCDICYCLERAKEESHVTLVSYIAKRAWDDKGPYSGSPPLLCASHAQELGLLW
ncbi:hypothetical protein LCGC14_0849930 [marine sediment metagenome]|uniref:Uncharacterized protein n=1 Tax=marine sediment metagenome TaxID=412755 RepID=A0A0F9SHN1_9ZZZZ